MKAPQPHASENREQIYNSRNSIGLLAFMAVRNKSIIYNIRNSIGLLAMALNAELCGRSTIVEIQSAYQPRFTDNIVCLNLQQQKFNRLISHRLNRAAVGLSTIVEIQSAYQPHRAHEPRNRIYNSRNSIGLLACLIVCI